MRESNIEPLKRMAEKIASSQAGDRLEHLSKAFELFSQETERIENAYNSLKEEFTSIHYELEEATVHLKKKVAELDVLNSYLQNILSNISQGLLFIDLNGDVTTYNFAAEKILNLPEKEVLYNNFWKNFSDDLFGFSMRLALASKNLPSTSFTIYENKEGQKKELEVTANFVAEDKKKNRNGDFYASFRRLEGVIILIRDITEIRALELLANRNDRLKELGEMAALVAHEIRNPLGGIKGFASLLKRDLSEDIEKQKLADYIVQGTDTLNRLVTNVLNYSRPVDLSPRQISITELIANITQSLKADPEVHPKINFYLEFEEDNKTLLADPELLKGALLNLLVNAMQAMPEGGDLTIAVNTKKEAVYIEIKDTGIGIDKENIEKIFTPFFTTKKEGHGFGLAEVHKVMQAHGGTIDVISQKGLGTTFTLMLPLKGVSHKLKIKKGNN